MKEIRFRYVCLNKHFNKIELVYLTDDLLREQDHVPSWIFSDNCEIKDKQLSTGRFDKLGKEIYQGDILRKYDSDTELYIVDDLLEFGLEWYEFMGADSTAIEIIGKPEGNLLR